MTETTVREYKALAKATTKEGLKEIAGVCVALANAQGGEILIGIDNRSYLPPPTQLIPNAMLNDAMKTIRGNAINVFIANPRVEIHENGGQYILLSVAPTSNVIATTADGRVLFRNNDECTPVTGTDLTRLASEKQGFQWELVEHPEIALQDINPNEIIGFANTIRNSPKVTNFIKQKNDDELLEHYHLLHQGVLTNLGILWLGYPNQRARLFYPISVEYIVYDAKEEKRRKETWTHYDHNPKELLLDIEARATELRYFDELPEGLFRKQVRHYSDRLIRELLVNAIAHKIYVTANIISIQVYPDRMTITSPGSLPFGVTPYNILHARSRRNPHLMTVLHDMSLMEGEGSGYDLIYESLVRDAKPLPEIYSDINSVSVTIFSKTLDPEALQIIEFAATNYQLSQREIMALGVVATHKKILATQLSKTLQLTQDERLRSYITKLLEAKILITYGSGKGTAYLANPAFLRQANLNLRPTLKTLEPHVLQALIIQDIKQNGLSATKEIHQRLEGSTLQEISRNLYKLVAEGTLYPHGAKRNRKYELAEKK